MKTLFRMMALFALLFAAASCSDDDEAIAMPSLDVNYANVAGTWKLSEWNGEELNDTRYYYITFNRKAEDDKRTYIIYTNLNSAVSERITGTFLLDKDDDDADVISGTYDYTMSINDAWENKYFVEELTNEKMSWKATENVEEVRVYTRCSEVPADIVNGIRNVK